MDRSMTNPLDVAGSNDNGRPLLKSFEGGGDGRRITKTFLRDGGLNNYGRASVKSNFGGGLRVLWWLPLLGWALSAVIFTFVYLGIPRHSESCSTTNSMANITRDIGATVRSLTDASHDPKRMVENLAEVVDFLHVTEGKHQKQQHLIPDANKERHLPHCEFPSQLTKVHLLECAVHVARENMQKTRALGAEAPPRRIAFMFLSRGELPLESLWARFLEGHEDHYSLYAHTKPDFTFPNDSFFYGHQVPNDKASRFSITLVDAVRRLLAYALLDPENGATNSWFVLACETTIPLRSFNFTYNYLMQSQNSFVESFRPRNEPIQWFDRAPIEPFAREKLRKGEMWTSMQLRHVLIVLEDWDLYYTYKRLCMLWCAPDEQYIPTLLGIKDPGGIENRTVVYVNWEEGHRASPHMHHADDLSTEWFEDIRRRTTDVDGQYHDSSRDSQAGEKDHNVTRSCSYNGVANFTCFLFARKVAADAKEHLDSLSGSVLEY